MTEIERDQDVGDKGAMQRAKFVKLQLKMADKAERPWRQEGDRIEKLYRREKKSKATSGNRMNILWSNTEIMKPALYQGTPSADVRRRHPDQNPVAREAARVLERAIEYSIDQYPFDDEVELDVTDSLLPGRGVGRLRYKPTIASEATEFEITQAPAENDFGFSERFFRTGTDPNDLLNQDEIDPSQVQQRPDGSLFGTTEAEEVVYEECELEHVPWDDYRQTPAKRWRHVWWIAFRHLMTREQLVAEFGGKGARCKLNWEPKGLKDQERNDEPDDSFKKAEVWEFWDKRKRQVVYVAEGCTETLREDDDPLSLSEFFPIPEPLYSMKTGRTLIPVPEYTLYEDQAKELDRITARIDMIVKELRVRGVYDGAMERVAELLKEGLDNKLIPVDNWQRFVEKGGFDGVVDWMPIDRFAEVLTVLYQQRAQLIETIYQLTGISDILRGATDPRETRGAQQLKAQFGTLRLRPRQARVARYVRDIFRLKAEIIAEQFSKETLTLMTGIQVTDQMLDLIRDEGRRGFSIDVETDTTVAPDEQRDKQEVTEFLTALGGFAQAAAASGLPPAVSGPIALWAARKFKVSREVEEILERAAQQGAANQNQEGGEQPDPSRMAKVHADAAKAQGDQALKGKEIQLEAQDNQADQQLEREKLNLEREQFEFEREKWRDEVRLREKEIAQGHMRPEAA